MRILRVGAVAVVLGFAAMGTARAGDAPAYKDPWTSFKPGSSVTMKTSTKTSMEGAPEMPSQESRMTLVSVTEKEYVLKSETKLGDAWRGQEMTIPRGGSKGIGDEVKPPPVEDLGEEKVTVDGAAYSCKKTKVTVDGATIISWTNSEHGTLKSETTLPGGGASSNTVTSLSKTFSVAGKDVTCKETKSTSSMMGSETSTVMLSSEAIPGRTVRSEMSSKTAGMTMTSVTEVTAFEAK